MYVSIICFLPFGVLSTSRQKYTPPKTNGWIPKKLVGKGNSLKKMTIFWYQFVWFQWCNPTKTITTPKINIEPQNGKLEDDFPVFSHGKPRLDAPCDRHWLQGKFLDLCGRPASVYSARETWTFFTANLERGRWRWQCGVSCNVNIKMMCGKVVNLDFLGLFFIIDWKILKILEVHISGVFFTWPSGISKNCDSSKVVFSSQNEGSGVDDLKSPNHS